MVSYWQFLILHFSSFSNAVCIECTVILFYVICIWQLSLLITAMFSFCETEFLCILCVCFKCFSSHLSPVLYHPSPSSSRLIAFWLMLLVCSLCDTKLILSYLIFFTISSHIKHSCWKSKSLSSLKIKCWNPWFYYHQILLHGQNDSININDAGAAVAVSTHTRMEAKYTRVSTAYLTGDETIWPPFCRGFIQIHFLVQKNSILIRISLKYVPKFPINNTLALV